MDLKVIDNFLPKEYFSKLQELVLMNEQPWFFLSSPTTFDLNTQKTYSFGCNVVLLNQPESYNPLLSCSKYIKLLNEHVKSSCNFKRVIRCRLDMTTYRGEQITFHPHVDLSQKHYTSIFYLTKCNAPTIIYNQQHFSEETIDTTNLTIMKQIIPDENKLVVFDGNYIHTGTSATDVSRRILVNTNYI